MTDSFGGLVGPILQHVIDLRESFRRGENPSPEAVKRGLIKLFQDAQRRATDAKAGDFALAQFALVYWADEVLIKSAWRFADSWKNSILELDYFGTRRAAVDFWDRAKQAEEQTRVRGRAPRNVDALETFFLCAALGFRGELFQDETELEAWAARVAPILRAATPEELAASPTGLGARDQWGLGVLRGERALVGMSWLVAATAILTLLGFIAAVHQRGT